MFARLVSALFVLLLVSRAAAQAPAVDDAARERARGIFGEGVAALDAGDCPTALAKFREAYEIAREPSILYNLATAESECHDPAMAAAHYRQFLAEVRSGRAARFRPDAQRQLRTLERSLGHLAVTVEGGRDGDVVQVDDRTAANPGDVEVGAGEHTVTLVRGGRSVARATVTVAAGQRASVTVTAPAETAPSPTAVAEAAPRERAPRDRPDRAVPAVRKRRFILGASGAALGFIVLAAVGATR